MSKFYFTIILAYVFILIKAQTVFINEIHYDNSGTDANEGVEIAGPAGTDVTGYQIIPYNGNGGGTYTPIITLSGTIPNQQNGYGTIWSGIINFQNGSPDGVALVNASGTVIQFLSYEGSFTATAGPASGMTSIDIGISENGNVSGSSLQLVGSGLTYSSFQWIESTASPGNVNINQNFVDTSLDWVGMVWPTSATVDFATGGATIYAQAYKAGITDPAGQAPNISSKVGFSKTNTDPSTWPTANWQAATYNAGATNAGNNDEYQSTLGPIYTDGSWYMSPGLYFYASQFTYNDGSPYFAGIKADGSGGGPWDGTTYGNGKLYVTTQVKPGWINAAVMNNAETRVLAQAAVNATMYEFEITKPDNSVQVISASNNYFTFSQVTGLQYGVNYAVRVRAQVTDGEWLPWGISANLSVALPSTTIRPSNCGLTYTNAAWQVPAVAYPGAEAYTFKFDDGTTVQEVEVVGDTRTFFTAINYVYGTTYAISVKVKLNGTYGPYGTPCNITLGIPTTTIRPGNCGLTYTNAAWQVPAVPIAGAEAYTFKFDDGTTVQEVEVVGNDRTYFTAINYVYGTTYAISVKVKVNGTYGSYGTPCNITLGIPTTTIKPGNCGLTYSSTAWQIPAAPIAGAEAYTFEFNDGTTTEEIEVVGDTRTFLSALSTPPTSYTSYSIRVKVKVNGVYGPYGNACTIIYDPVIISRPENSFTDNIKSMAYPNPFQYSFSLKLDNHSDLNIKIFDNEQRLLEQYQVKANEDIPQMGMNLKPGYYIVLVEQEGEVNTYRVIKN